VQGIEREARNVKRGKGWIERHGKERGARNGERSHPSSISLPLILSPLSLSHSLFFFSLPEGPLSPLAELCFAPRGLINDSQVDTLLEIDML
jgi:hypothetical protein